MYQLQDLLTDAQIDALDAQPYDMVVVEAGNTIKQQEKFNTAGMVTRLHTKANGSPRKVIAYIDIGQAESFRTYWIDKQWKAPTTTKPGVPDFILTVDPDGWAGDYPVAYWDPRWQDLWLGPNGAVAQLAREVFDGVYLDWWRATPMQRWRPRPKGGRESGQGDGGFHRQDPHCRPCDQPAVCGDPAECS
ncbi:hypothetical protein ACEQUB_02325 [Ralstonia syzygii]